MVSDRSREGQQRWVHFYKNLLTVDSIIKMAVELDGP